MTRAEALDEMIRDAFALRKRGLMRDADGRVVKIRKIKREDAMAIFELFKSEDFRKQVYEEPSGKRPRPPSIMDEDEEEEDAKLKQGYHDEADEDEDEADDDEMDEADRKRRGMKFKMSFRDIVLGDESQRRVGTYPLEEQESARQPRPADEGEDRLGRRYGESAYVAAGGLNVDMGPIPTAGAGDTWEGDTRDLGYRPAAFMPGDEGEAGRVGGEDRGVEPVPPNRGNRESYELLRENLTPQAVPVRVGPNFVMNPQASGIAPASGFDASQSDPALTVKRRVFKSKGGLFGDVVFDRSEPDSASSFLG